MIPCPVKTPLVVCTLLILQLLHHTHLFTVFTSLCMLSASRSETHTVTFIDKSCPWLVQYYVYFQFNFSSLSPSLEPNLSWMLDLCSRPPPDNQGSHYNYKKSYQEMNKDSIMKHFTCRLHLGSENASPPMSTVQWDWRLTL